MEVVSFRLDSFEGPLDLLLHLISKNKMNIFEVDISSLLEQYLKFIDEAQRLDLEGMSDFLKMASRLVYIKTVSLLPKQEEHEKLRDELVGELIEYRLCQLAAEFLKGRWLGGQIFVREPMEIDVDKTYKLSHDITLLEKAYAAVTGNKIRRMPPPAETFAPLVSRTFVSVNSRIIHILRSLYKSGELDFMRLFEEGERSERVATFLAVLELIKAGRISVLGEQTLKMNKKASNNRQESIAE